MSINLSKMSKVESVWGLESSWGLETVSDEVLVVVLVLGLILIMESYVKLMADLYWFLLMVSLTI